MTKLTVGSVVRWSKEQPFLLPSYAILLLGKVVSRLFRASERQDLSHVFWLYGL